MIVGVVILLGLALVAYLAFRPSGCTNTGGLFGGEGGDGTSKAGRSIQAIGGGLTTTVAAIADASAGAGA